MRISFLIVAFLTMGASSAPAADAPPAPDAAPTADTAPAAEGEGEEDMDDFDPLAELAGLGDSMIDTGPEAGGSIRAKRDADMGRSTRLRAPENAEGRVEVMKLGAFPAVALKIKITKAAKKGPGKKLKRNETIVVLPKYKSVGKRVDFRDIDSVMNASAYYLKKGDRVVFKLGKKKGGTWEVLYIERK
ncbi:hypothetical protein KAI87_01540 [Myxococcota bacterium]|nr:hypothetical protein [Myxococcota bacterium]